MQAEQPWAHADDPAVKALTIGMIVSQPRLIDRLAY